MSVSGTPIFSRSTFSNRTLAELGFTTESPIGTWTLRDTTTADKIQVVVSQVPGPLPLVGAAAAFGWSRTLRRRIATAKAKAKAKAKDDVAD
jgi:hypothetical protein